MLLALSVITAAIFDIPISLITISNCSAIYSPVCEFSLDSNAFQKISCDVVIIKLIIGC